MLIPHRGHPSQLLCHRRSEQSHQPLIRLLLRAADRAASRWTAVAQVYGLQSKNRRWESLSPMPSPFISPLSKKSGEVIKTFSAPYCTNTTRAIGLTEHQMLISFCGIFGSVSIEISQSVVVLNKLKHRDEIASEALKV